MSEPKIRIPRPEVLQAAFANIQANLAHWNQITWVTEARCANWAPPENTCGTTACLAGHILLSQGVDWQGLKKQHGVEGAAMRMLGFELAADDVGDLSWGPDGEDFIGVFYFMDDPDTGADYEYTQEAFDKFKARVSERTGVEL